MKSVLLYVQHDDGLESRLQAALSVVRATGGHLSCVNVTLVDAYRTFVGFSSLCVIDDIETELVQKAIELRVRIEERLEKENISWDYAHVMGETVDVLIEKAALSDLLVVGPMTESETAAYLPATMFGDLIAAMQTPLLVQPLGQKLFEPRGTAVVAWNGSFESAHALRAAVPLLALASNVKIVTIDEEKTLKHAASEAAAYLRYHGIESDLHSQRWREGSLAANLVARAHAFDANCIVMGAYGHSRTHEFIFGGVTREMLQNPSIPLILAH